MPPINHVGPMKKLLTCLLIISGIYCNAQGLKAKKAARYDTRTPIDTIDVNNQGSVYVYLDQSNKVKFYGGICFPEFSYFSSNPITFSTGAHLDFFLKKISLHGSYTFSLFDYMHLMSNNENETNYSENTIGRFQTFEAGGSYFLSAKHVHRKFRLVLERHGSSRYTVEYYILPKLPCREIIAVRGGYWGYNTGVSTNQNSYSKVDGNGAVKAKDGAIFTQNYYTTEYVRGGYLGISRTRLFACVTKNTFRRGAVYANRDRQEMYADLLFGIATFDPIIDSNGGHAIVANASGSFQTLPIGARAGYSSTSYGGRISKKIELGYRPGLKDQGLYVALSCSFSLSNKVRK